MDGIICGPGPSSPLGVTAVVSLRGGIAVVKCASGNCTFSVGRGRAWACVTAVADIIAFATWCRSFRWGSDVIVVVIVVWSVWVLWLGVGAVFVMCAAAEMVGNMGAAPNGSDFGDNNCSDSGIVSEAMAQC